MNKTCPSAAQCPIFNGILSGKTLASQSYRDLFCEAGEAKWSSCKRYLTKKKFGKCPPDLLPNDFNSVEQIGILYKL